MIKLFVFFAGVPLLAQDSLALRDAVRLALRENRSLAAATAGVRASEARMDQANKQVAYALSISEQTVKNHMSSILRKLSVNDRTQAVVYAMRQGWIRMPDD